jgi:hypothetical protein
VTDYDEDSFEFDYNEGEDDDDIKEALDSAASLLDGSWYYSNSRDGPELSTADAKPGHDSKVAAARASACGNASGRLVVFRSVEAANEKAA